jgi:hypothetical protein
VNALTGHPARLQPVFSMDMFTLTGNAQNCAVCSIKAHRYTGEELSNGFAECLCHFLIR